MHWLGLVTLAAAGVVVARWFMARTDSLGRPRAFPWLGVGGLVVIGLAALTPWFLRARLETRMAEAASEIVGHPVEVECQSFGQAFVDVGAEFGYVVFRDGRPEPRTLIKRQQCRDLAAYLRSDMESPSTAHVVALHTLTHEAVHMSGVTNEAETECIAVQLDTRMAELLGASSDAARAAAATYWRSIYPRMPGGYRSDECRPGGALDRGGGNAPWDL
ncbi:MAG TPA: hypothetical protein VJ927_02910 [Actinomycetota bacterium]|nr:hypothetical protein [Actinomycetota bacterium]